MKKLCLAVFLCFFFLVTEANAFESTGISAVSVHSGSAGNAIHTGENRQDLQLSANADEKLSVDGSDIKDPSEIGILKEDKNPRETENQGEDLNDPAGETIGDADLNDTESDYVPEEEGPLPKAIYDPIEPFNRVMYQFNDKLYFWLLKPVGQAYGKVVPEPARVSVRNFFDNLGFPIRFLSCLLQADLGCAGMETERFAVNTIWGIGGLMDVSSSQELNIPEQDVDLGQTLGVYGVGHGFYIVWPVFGPSSVRDSADIVGGFFLDPADYLNPWYMPIVVRGYKTVNETSLRIGDYESLKQVALDPYIAIRDAFVQYRLNKVDARKEKLGRTRSVESPSNQSTGKD